MTPENAWHGSPVTIARYSLRIVRLSYCAAIKSLGAVPWRNPRVLLGGGSIDLACRLEEQIPASRRGGGVDHA